MYVLKRTGEGEGSDAIFLTKPEWIRGVQFRFKARVVIPHSCIAIHPWIAAYDLKWKWTWFTHTPLKDPYALTSVAADARRVLVDLKSVVRY